jgi:hypothetical protein
MVKVGDRIRLSSGKGPDRDGVVTAVTGSMVRVQWPSGEETTVVPAPGTLTVLASSGDQAPAVRRERAAPEGPAAKKAAAKKAAPEKASPGRGATKRAATAKNAATKKITTSTKGAAKKTTDVKRSSR